VTAFYRRPKDTVIRLFSPGSYGSIAMAGVPVEDVELETRKNGEDAFSARALLPEEWVDLNNGFYAIRWTADDFDTLGSFAFFVTGPDIEPQFGVFDIDPAPLALLAEPGVCVVTGNIVDIGGNGMRLEPINFRPRNVPGAVGNSIIAAGLIQTTTDAFGNFSVALIRGSTVIVEIERAAIRYQIIVPDESSASILDLLPPITPIP